MELDENEKDNTMVIKAENGDVYIYNLTRVWCDLKSDSIRNDKYNEQKSKGKENVQVVGKPFITKVINGLYKVKKIINTNQSIEKNDVEFN